MNTNTSNNTNDTQINWLELARFAAEGQGHADLGRGVRRLAILAAAAHRDFVARGTATVAREVDDAQNTPHATGATR